MTKKFKGLLGSTTMPVGTGGFSGFGHIHVHAPDGSCCGHNHGHGHDHEHGNAQPETADDKKQK